MRALAPCEIFADVVFTGTGEIAMGAVAVLTGALDATGCAFATVIAVGEKVAENKR